VETGDKQVSQAAMKQALEALERGETKLRYEAITALRAVLERSQEECGATYSSKLQCVFNGWRVLSDGEIALDMPEHNCCDMRGAIDIASVIMPSVWKISIFCGGMPDVMYILINGKWGAYDQRYGVKKTNKQSKNELRERNA
jgi:hypothetical protein